MNNLVPTPIDALPGKLSRVGWRLAQSMTFEEWIQIGETLRTIKGSLFWWIGDWLNFGEQKWGEMYAQALETTNYDYATLADAKWVASRVELSRRRETLSWSHHRDVAALEAEKQEIWLDKADKNQWSRAELREAIRNKKKKRRGRIVSCPECGHEFEVG